MRRSGTTRRHLSRIVRRLDPRVRRTRNALGDALIALMQERPFDAISVGDVLERAGVGRSTFYVHYRDKDDLFTSDVDDFWMVIANRLLVTDEPSDRIAPVRELFAHCAGMRGLLDAMRAAGKQHEVAELGRLHFARAVDARLARLPRTTELPPLRRHALAHAAAGAIFSLLEWWLSTGEPFSAQEADDLIHRSFWHGLVR